MITNVKYSITWHLQMKVAKSKVASPGFECVTGLCWPTSPSSISPLMNLQVFFCT